MPKAASIGDLLTCPKCTPAQLPSTGDNTSPHTHSGRELLSFIERIENLDEEARGIAADRRDVLAEAKGGGYCPKTIRKIVAIRRMSPSDRYEEEQIMETYKAAIGLE